MSTTREQRHKSRLKMLYSEEFLHRNPFPEWFDAHLLGGHPQVEAILDGEVFEVDENSKIFLNASTRSYC